MNKINFGELVSFLQKSIRRGLVEETIFCLKEFNNDGYANCCFKRMLLICSEDIGLANINSSNYVMINYLIWKELVKKYNKEKGIPLTRTNSAKEIPKANNILYETGYYLCKVKKSRKLALTSYYILRELKEIPKKLDYIDQVKNLFKNFNQKKLEDFSTSLYYLFSENSKINERKLLDCFCYLFLFYNNDIKSIVKLVRFRIEKGGNFNSPSAEVNLDLLLKQKIVLFLYNSILIIHRELNDYEYIKIDRFKNYGDYNYEFKKVPDYVLDKHTRRGKSMGRDIKHFLDVGAIVNNEDENLIDDYYLNGRKAYIEDEKEYGTSESKTKFLIERKKKELSENKVDGENEAPKSKKIQKKKGEISKNKVYNENESPISKYFQKKKEELSKNKVDNNDILISSQNEVKLESEVFRFPIRAQIPTSKSKPDTYYAIDEEGKSFFVKGPYKNEQFAIIQYKCDLIKEILNNYVKKEISDEKFLLNKLNVKIIELKPDINFLEKRELSSYSYSYRRFFRYRRFWRYNDYNKVQKFIIMDDLCDYDYKNPKTKIKNSKSYGDLVIFDKDKYNCNTIKVDDSDEVFIILLFRFLFGINDTNESNIMKKGNKYYSVDENNYFTDIKYLFKKLPNKKWVKVLDGKK